MKTLYKTLVYIFLFINLVLANRVCNLADATINECSDSEYCTENKLCECIPGTQRINSTFCQKSNDSPNSSSLITNHDSASVVAGILIPICIIGIVILGIFLNRKYNLIEWVRQKINQRNSVYDEFMIGQDDDDPPLA